ncbi:hypothetical protein POM88_041026 [Heracleum sosnowskyi]|uniref:TF-B3 domain-containing protein n=1 Tax=Heracleum sosnowskyi TaxID=360622 RepID=A0AAD8HDD8_9APIA|nr:hypothetical protein POM88_041026 [Heracleum sosnowskyi]
MTKAQPVTLDIENKTVKMSFAAAISEEYSFGTLRVPNPFVEKFGHNIPRNIKIICKGGMMWKAVYDSGRQKIIGLEDFMKIHKVKQMYTLLLDYLGDGYFNVQIYNTYGVEVYKYQCHWNMENPSAELKFSEYVLGLNKLEDEKARSLFFSTAYGSAYGRYLRYYELSMDEPHFHVGMSRMMLPKNISDLYGSWKNGEIIKFYFIEIFWEVTIEVSGDDHYLGNGWSNFVKDCGLQKNDILVFNAVIEQLQDMVHVCLFKSNEIHRHELRSGIPSWNASFFSVLNPRALCQKEIVPPILVRKFYHANLSKVDTIRCGESTFSVSYNANSRTMKNIQMILDKYDIQRNDTFFITTTENHEANMRIFRRDGIEVAYQNEYSTHTINPDHCFPYYPLMLLKCVSMTVRKVEDAQNRISSDTVEDTNDTGNDTDESIMNMGEFIDDGEESDNDDVIEEADNLYLGEFFATLSKSNVDSHCHGVYISKDLDEFISHWNSGQIVFLVRNGLRRHIGINVTNGRKRFSAGWSTFVDNNGLNENDS